MIKTIAFDVGNVLLHLDFERQINALATAGGVNAGEVRKKYMELDSIYQAGGDSFLVDYESGRLEDSEFLRLFTAALGIDVNEADFVKAFNQLFLLNKGTAAIVESLAGHYDLALLSNTGAYHANCFMKDFPVFSHFPTCIFSHEVGVMKPDKRIYHEALAILGIKPEELFFTDDKEENIEAARAVGINSFRYTGDDEALRNALIDRGLIV